MKTLLFGLCCLPLLSADFLPLANGNQWTYRLAGGATRTITVGTPLSAAGHIYYRVNGYAVKPLWLRSEADAVYFYDEETEKDRELLRFTPGPLTTPISGCEQSADAQREQKPYEGVAGRFAAALEVRYQPLNCRDVGYQSEFFVDNIGLLKRTETSIAGPRTMELVYAKIGSITIEPGRKTALSLTLDKPTVSGILPGDTLALKATLRLSVADGSALKLNFSSSQRYDLAIRDANGQIVHLWSAAALFLAVTGTETISGQRVWTIDTNVSGLLPGNYQVEAWLTTTEARILSVATPLQVTLQ